MSLAKDDPPGLYSGSEMAAAHQEERQFFATDNYYANTQVSTRQVLPVLGLVRQRGHKHTEASVVRACIAIRGERDEPGTSYPCSRLSALSQDLRKRRRFVARLICLVSGP